jgi:hypothetical protein
MFRNEALFLDGSLGDPEKRMNLPERLRMKLETGEGVEVYEVFNNGGLIVFDFMGTEGKVMPPDPGLGDVMRSPAQEGDAPEKPKKKSYNRKK